MPATWMYLVSTTHSRCLSARFLCIKLHSRFKHRPGSHLYAWVGWTCHPSEQHYDLGYIPQGLACRPELWAVDRLAHAIAWTAWAAAWAVGGEANATYGLIAPMLLTRLLSLEFNVK